MTNRPSIIKQIARVMPLAGIFILSACSGSDSPINSPDTGSSSSTSSSGNSSSSSSSSSGNGSHPVGPPVPTDPPNAEGQSPAFAKQNRAPEVDSDVELDVEVIAENLGIPWSLAFLPDGRMLVTSRAGELRIVTPNGMVSQALEGVPEVVAQGQGGLLDLVLDPEFETNRWVYFSFSQDRGNGQNATAVARAKLNEDETGLTELDIIFQQNPAWDSNLHFGSRLVFDEQGLLYVTLGERSHSEPRQLAQDVTTTLGKVIRIRPDGSVPPSNPFVGSSGADEVWSYGHRNPQGAALHPETGELWTIEHGPRGGDEINQPEAGLNYGWPVITYGEEYSGAPVGDGVTTMAGMEQPLYYWDPVIAPSDMTFYTGSLFPQWQGNLFIGSMTPGGIVRLVLDGETVIGEERLLQYLGRIREIAEGPDGALYATSDNSNYSLVRITPRN